MADQVVSGDIPLEYLPIDAAEVCMKAGLIGFPEMPPEHGLPSFSGLLHWEQHDTLPVARGLDICFGRNQVGDYVVSIPDAEGTSNWHTVVVEASRHVSLQRLTHLILASVLAPGYVGVDWADVCRVLRSGCCGYVKAAEEFELMERQLNSTNGQANGLMGVISFPEKAPFMDDLGDFLGFTKRLVSEHALVVVGAPILAEGMEKNAVILILGKNQ